MLSGVRAAVASKRSARISWRISSGESGPHRRLVGQDNGLVSGMPNFAKSPGKWGGSKVLSGRKQPAKVPNQHFCRLIDALRARCPNYGLLEQFADGIAQFATSQCGCIDFQAASVLVQPIDQAILLRPVFAPLIDDRGTVAGRLRERAIARLGDHGIDGAKQVGKAEAE